jgi:flagellin-like hook-associated protein FlgL
MASNITLSAGVRQNLLSLQNTATLSALTQNRLATGKKVNSALDNPTNFFTSQSLSNRASDLNSLLDSIGQAQKTLEAADKGITSLTKLVESAKSIAKQARQAPGPSDVTYGALSVTSTTDAESVGTFTASAYAAPAAAGTISLDVNVGGTITTVTTAAFAGTETAAQAATLIQNAITGNGATAGQVTVDTSGGFIRITAANADVDVQVNANAASFAAGLTTSAVADRDINSTSLLDNIGGTGTLSIAVNGGANQTITFGNGVGEVSRLSELNTALASLTGVTASVTTPGGALSIAVASSATANSLTLTGSSAGVTGALNISNGTINGTPSVSTPSASRTSLQSDYNALLTQIDALAGDASYNGINLLNGDDLKVVFNETGTSSQTISGVTYNSGGLGLTTISGTGFQSDANIDATITAIDGALSTLRTQASKFGSNLSTVQTRQDFTKQLINTLQTGADALVLADSNEEGANLLALQTRQQLSSTALSLSAQADQAVLRLFG